MLKCPQTYKSPASHSTRPHSLLPTLHYSLHTYLSKISGTPRTHVGEGGKPLHPLVSLGHVVWSQKWLPFSEWPKFIAAASMMKPCSPGMLKDGSYHSSFSNTSSGRVTIHCGCSVSGIFFWDEALVPGTLRDRAPCLIPPPPIPSASSGGPEILKK